MLPFRNAVIGTIEIMFSSDYISFVTRWNVNIKNATDLLEYPLAMKMLTHLERRTRRLVFGCKLWICTDRLTKSKLNIVYCIIMWYHFLILNSVSTFFNCNLFHKSSFALITKMNQQYPDKWIHVHGITMFIFMSRFTSNFIHFRFCISILQERAFVHHCLVKNRLNV